ncbi:hypothetical protein L1085_000310 [Streptomyces sp. MSC1_001]|jgi:hypothetical protein|uniref:hypothetical protein n=1 Tax=Streptomyces sp. MSC1_001 TaxID=2909263 RepID=UPI00202EA1A6|nr:hypothetical protein [Streptomyces sp. MSC1_001]
MIARTGPGQASRTAHAAKALRAGELEERRKTLLDAPEAGMVWEPGEEAWENKLAAQKTRPAAAWSA